MGTKSIEQLKHEHQIALQKLEDARQAVFDAEDESQRQLRRVRDAKDSRSAAYNEAERTGQALGPAR